MNVEHQSTTDSIPIVGPTAAVAVSHPNQIEASNALVVSNRTPETSVEGREAIRPRKMRKTQKVLLLCGGPNGREVSI